MKTLRKCACVAVQLVVTTVLLFQQCPVQAFAAPEQIQSDNEVIESVADQGDEVDAQAVDSAENSAADDSAPAPQAVASTEPSSVPKPSSPGVWKTVGSCLWMIDESGLMTIKPQGDEAGYVYRDWMNGSYGYPWEGQKRVCHCRRIRGGCRLRELRETV